MLFSVLPIQMQCISYIRFSVQQGTAYAYAGTAIPTIGQIDYGQIYNGSQMFSSTLCGTYTVETGKQTICFGATLVTGGTVSINKIQMTATRIA